MNPEDFVIPSYSTQESQGQKRKRSTSRNDPSSQSALLTPESASQTPVPDPQEEPDSRLLPEYLKDDVPPGPQEELINQLWIDKYAPRTKNETAIMPKKIMELEDTIRRSALRNGSIKLILLDGPCGCGKSTLVRLLCKEQDLMITEWDTATRGTEVHAMNQFEAFLRGCTQYQGFQQSQRIVLLDDLPDLTTFQVKERFRIAIKNALAVNKNFLIFMVLSDAVIHSDNERRKENFSNMVIPQDLKNDDRIASVSFPAVNKTNMKRTLDIIARAEHVRLSSSELNTLLESSNGDIRLAINTLQFMSNESNALQISPRPAKAVRKAQDGKNLVDFKNQTGHLDLFHAVGKALYAKRDMDGKYESSVDDIINKLPIETDYYVSYLHENCLHFFQNQDIEDCARALIELSDADIIHSSQAWQDKAASVYQGYVSTHGIMKNRVGEIKGQFKELSATKFYKIQKEAQENMKNAKSEEWLASVRSRTGEEEPEDIMEMDPIECFTSDEDDQFDDLFGDGADLAELDF